MQNLGVNGRIIPERVLKKYSGKLQTDFFQLMIAISGGLF